MTLYHGGISGKRPGDILVPSPPHVSDGCPICVARAEGRVCSVGEYRYWLRQFGERGKPILAQLEGALDTDPIDPPSGRAAVYVTTSLPYARWYAARSQGDLYAVEPIGEAARSPEDPFPSWTCDAARVVAVVERHVRLVRKDRRELSAAAESARMYAERGAKWQAKTVEAAREAEREACAMECRVMAERYEAAGNDVAAMATLEIMDAIRSRSAAGGGPNG